MSASLDGGDCLARVLARETIGDGVDDVVVAGNTTCGDDLIERRQRVARRPAPDAQHVVDLVVVDVEAGILGHVTHVLAEFVGRNELELVVLGAAPDGGDDLVRLGGSEHEHDVVRRLLERLQQCVLGTGREHVDFVEDVHLGAAGRAQGNLRDEITNGLDAVVRRSVELLEVVGRTGLERDAGFACAAGLAVVAEVGAVQRLAENASRARLAGSPGSAEQVGVAHTVVGDRILQGGDHVLLPDELAERA